MYRQDLSHIGIQSAWSEKMVEHLRLKSTFELSDDDHSFTMNGTSLELATFAMCMKHKAGEDR